MTRYQRYYYRKKSELRDEAVAMQAYIIDNELAWWDYQDAVDELRDRARKYGLIRELDENGIC